MIGQQTKPLTASQQKKLNACLAALGAKLGGMSRDQLVLADPASLSRSYAVPLDRVSRILNSEISRRV